MCWQLTFLSAFLIRKSFVIITYQKNACQYIVNVFYLLRSSGGDI